jgi:hypothetical protein
VNTEIDSYQRVDGDAEMICVVLPSGARARVRRSIKPETVDALDEMAAAIMDRDGLITQAWDERGNKIELELGKTTNE